MGILLADASHVIVDGTAADHDGAAYHPLAYRGRFSCRLHHGRTTFFLRNDSQKQPEAAHKSSTKPLYDGYIATRGEAQAGAR